MPDRHCISPKSSDIRSENNRREALAANPSMPLVISTIVGEILCGRRRMQYQRTYQFVDTANQPCPC